MQHASLGHVQPDCMQGLECRAAQSLLKHFALVKAVHGVLQAYARALPALAMPVLELTRCCSDLPATHSRNARRGWSARLSRLS